MQDTKTILIWPAILAAAVLALSGLTGCFQERNNLVNQSGDHPPGAVRTTGKKVDLQNKVDFGLQKKAMFSPEDSSTAFAFLSNEFGDTFTQEIPIPPGENSFEVRFDSLRSMTAYTLRISLRNVEGEETHANQEAFFLDAGEEKILEDFKLWPSFTELIFDSGSFPSQVNLMQLWVNGEMTGSHQISDSNLIIPVPLDATLEIVLKGDFLGFQDIDLFKGHVILEIKRGMDTTLQVFLEYVGPTEGKLGDITLTVEITESGKTGINIQVDSSAFYDDDADGIPNMVESESCVLNPHLLCHTEPPEEYTAVTVEGDSNFTIYAPNGFSVPDQFEIRVSFENDFELIGKPEGFEFREPLFISFSADEVDLEELPLVLHTDEAGEIIGLYQWLQSAAGDSVGFWIPGFSVFKGISLQNAQTVFPHPLPGFPPPVVLPLDMQDILKKLHPVAISNNSGTNPCAEPNLPNLRKELAKALLETVGTAFEKMQIPGGTIHEFKFTAGTHHDGYHLLLSLLSVGLGLDEGVLITADKAIQQDLEVELSGNLADLYQGTKTAYDLSQFVSKIPVIKSWMAQLSDAQKQQLKARLQKLYGALSGFLLDGLELEVGVSLSYTSTHTQVTSSQPAYASVVSRDLAKNTATVRAHQNGSNTTFLINGGGVEVKTQIKVNWKLKEKNGTVKVTCPEHSVESSTNISANLYKPLPFSVNNLLPKENGSPVNTLQIKPGETTTLTLDHSTDDPVGTASNGSLSSGSPSFIQSLPGISTQFDYTAPKMITQDRIEFLDGKFQFPSYFKEVVVDVQCDPGEVWNNNTQECENSCQPVDLSTLPLELVPREAMRTPDSSSNGLLAVYSDGDQRIEGPINFGPRIAGSSAPSWYPADQLADASSPALWQSIWGVGGETLTGTIEAPVTGIYEFHCSADDYCSVQIAGKQILLVTTPSSASGTIQLTEGRHPISITYQNRWGSNWFRLYWRYTCN